MRGSWRLLLPGTGRLGPLGQLGGVKGAGIGPLLVFVLRVVESGSKPR